MAARARGAGRHPAAPPLIAPRSSVSTSPWATAPLEEELVRAADRLVGGPDAVLVVDDTCLVKQGRRSVGVKRQYCGQLGKRANCQALVSLTLARAEVPVGVGLRLFVPEDWCADAGRRAAAGVPEAVGYRPKWRVALDEIDRVLASSARFGCVLADSEYGKAAEFRHGLSERHLLWAVGILPTQKVYPADVRLTYPARKPTGRPRKHPVPSAASVAAAELIESRPAAFRTISWRNGTKGPLRAEFAALRVRVADGPVAARAQHLPGDEAWLVAEHRASGERKYHLTNHPADTALEALAAVIKARPRPAAAGRACGNGSSALRSMGLRAAAPAAQGRAGPRPLRGPELARPAPPRAPVPARLHVPAAPSARGEKAPAPRPSPARHPGQACRRSGGASWPRSHAFRCAARTAGSASIITFASERGRVALERVTKPQRARDAGSSRPALRASTLRRAQPRGRIP